MYAGSGKIDGRGISQPLGYDFCKAERAPRMACFVPLDPKSRTPEFVRWCRIHIH